MNNDYIVKTIETFTKVTPTLDNMEDIISFKGFMPIQANSSHSTNSSGEVIFFGQLIVSYKSSYGGSDIDTGEEDLNNATHKKLIIKFPKILLDSQHVSATEFKSFFDEHFVKKSRLILPVTEEKQSFSNNVPVKNVSECNVSLDFDLKGFINSYSPKAK